MKLLLLPLCLLPLCSWAGVVEFGSMVRILIHRNPRMFIHYGHYCGFGGNGTAVDDIDKCCQDHDQCYDSIRYTLCHGVHGLAIPYFWSTAKVNGTTTAKCNFDNKKSCSVSICECDLAITLCLKNHMDSFNEKNIRKRHGTFDFTY